MTLARRRFSSAVVALLCSGWTDGRATVPAPAVADTTGFREAVADTTGLRESDFDTTGVGLREVAADTTALRGSVPDTSAARVDTTAARLDLPLGTVRLAPRQELLQPGAHYRVERADVERAGARSPIEVLGRTPGAYVETSGTTAGGGALARGGSWAGWAIGVDGFPVTTPRLDGFDLASAALGHLGPPLDWSHYASIGSFYRGGRDSLHVDPGRIEWATREAQRDGGAQSRVVVHHAGEAMTAGGVTLTDRRQVLDYWLGVMNGHIGANGPLAELSTRLASFDAAYRRSGWMFDAAVRNGERRYTWKDGRATQAFDQGARLVASRRWGDVAFQSRVLALDDRLSANASPDYRRRRFAAGLDVESIGAYGWFASVDGEADRMSIRSADRRLEPAVSRGVFEVGSAGQMGEWSWLAAGGGWASQVYAPELGGRVQLAWQPDPRWSVEGRARRQWWVPSADQEVLGVSRPRPERHDLAAATLDVDWGWRVSTTVTAHRGAGRATLEETLRTAPWPRYAFGFDTTEWLETEWSVLSPEVTPWRWQLGLTHTRFFLAAGSGPLPAFHPDEVARGVLSAKLDLFGGNMRLRPRLDVTYVGRRDDGSGVVLGDYLRTDGALVAIMSEQMDLEIAMRNMGHRAYPVAVRDQRTGAWFPAAGRTVMVGVRWRLLD